MATRRRTANWFQPPREEKVQEKGGHSAEGGRVGGSRYHFTLRYSKTSGASGPVLRVISPAWCHMGHADLLEQTFM